MFQIRNMPEDVHKKLKIRAAEEGISMSEWVLREVRRSLEIPTQAELRRRVAAREHVDADPTALLREIRDAR